ncbi:MAG: DUF2281 domain-containing protein [Geitlerinemataceae cyanobacterium]
MTIKEQLLQEIEALPTTRLPQVLTYVRSLHHRTTTNTAKPMSTGASILAHLKKFDVHWEGDDLQECLEEVVNSRGSLTFEAINPFDASDPTPDEVV